MRVSPNRIKSQFPERKLVNRDGYQKKENQKYVNQNKQTLPTTKTGRKRARVLSKKHQEADGGAGPKYLKGEVIVPKFYANFIPLIMVFEAGPWIYRN